MKARFVEDGVDVCMFTEPRKKFVAMPKGVCALSIELESRHAIIDITDQSGESVAFAVKQAIACGLTLQKWSAKLLCLGKTLFPCFPCGGLFLGGEDAKGERTGGIEDRPRKRRLFVVKDLADLRGCIGRDGA